MNAPARYLKSAWLKADYPPGDRPEVAVVGRSNAGKSSFLNAMFGSKLAKVSGSPGKTRSLNFFDFGKSYRWVDMPGYGFAARSKKEQVDWSKIIESYLAERECLAGLVLIMDVRRDWTEDEDLMLDWCQTYETPVAVILNKRDKVSKSEALQKKTKISKDYGVPVFLASCLSKEGIEEAEDFIFESWIKPGETEISS